MPETQTAPVAQIAPRLLRPDCILARLRPVSLGVLAGELRDAWRMTQALRLVERYFPERLDHEFNGAGWLEALGCFLNLADAAGWLAVEWGKIMDLERWAMEAEADEDEDEAGEAEGLVYLAEYLNDLYRASGREEAAVVQIEFPFEYDDEEDDDDE